MEFRTKEVFESLLNIIKCNKTKLTHKQKTNISDQTDINCVLKD